MAGALPFGAVFIELFFILESLFENEFYYMFGMGFESAFTVRDALTKAVRVNVNPKQDFSFWYSSLLSLQLPKSQLSSFIINFAMKVRPCPCGPNVRNGPSTPSTCNRFLDHYWMWKSFISGGGISLYVFGYLIYYHIVKLDITSFTPIVLYFR